MTLSITVPRTVLVHGASDGARKKKATVVIAALRFRLASGHSKRFTIKVTKASALSLLRQKGKLKATATITSVDGAGHHASKTVSITLRLSRPPKR